MVTQKEIKESNRDGVNMWKKMAHLKIVYKGPGSDHKRHTAQHNTKRQTQTIKQEPRNKDRSIRKA